MGLLRRSQTPAPNGWKVVVPGSSTPLDWNTTPLTEAEARKILCGGRIPPGAKLVPR